jgi:rubredoxin
MKLAPDLKKIEEMLRSSQLVAGGFLGDDTRALPDIIEADAAELDRLGYTRQAVADRMEHITHLARYGQGMAVKINANLEAVVDESRGSLVCPWPGEGTFLKSVTTATRRDTQKSLHWSDLCIHLIRAHGFFQGRGSAFRLEPEELIETIFSPTDPQRMVKYQCQACGYTYNPAVGDPLSGIPANTSFDELPPNWHCPICGARKEMFKELA